jgi:hypothetical protein
MYALDFFEICWAVFLLVIFGGGLIVRQLEKREWNNGICEDNNLPWESRDMDSQGGRYYKAGNKGLWVSYNVDKVRK